MKSEFQAKFLQHMLGRKKSEKGFTLIELLVVIIIIGILAAIALPSFLNQAAKSKQSEGKTTIGAVNRAQQAYRIEGDSFADDIADLKIGFTTQGTHYKYVVDGGTDTSFITAIATTDTSTLAAYKGTVRVVGGLTRSYTCQTVALPAAAAPAVTDDATSAEAACGSKEAIMK
ncbi:MAG: type IV pilin-like G/H family protein [Oscillatoriophycideae cyanobacterium NC_groundwater_1537_Pr4_S-0.65um_50_18]|nr:type IV pilin-like G/H family protein [Oscillatoriophycideae cyanobacterium NC_groundwater_1537_Pr4_S-0.65um_50_18]